MRFGYWLPVFGGWLRNVDDEGMAPTWEYVKTLAQRSERWGYDLTLIAELNLNDIKGTQAPSLDAWSTAASLAAVTSTLELMVAVRPTFHEPALLAKQAANIDHISGGRLALNVVSSWWAEEAKQYGVQFDQHDERYARTREWLAVVDGLWSQPQFSFKGRFYDVQNAILEPKPRRQPPPDDARSASRRARPRPTIYAGGESETARDLIADLCDAYVMHGDPPAIIHRRIEDMWRRREGHGKPPMTFGVAAYAIVRDSADEAQREVKRITDVKQSAAGYGNYQQWIANTRLEQRVSLEDYSVSNRGLRSGLIGTPEQIIARVQEFEDSGVDLLLLQCSPQLEEMERFARQVIEPSRRRTSPTADPSSVLHAALSEGIRTW
jgi:FMNH2-dependent dimethyl sulfone monooxygenase